MKIDELVTDLVDIAMSLEANHTLEGLDIVYKLLNKLEKVKRID